MAILPDANAARDGILDADRIGVGLLDVGPVKRLILLRFLDVSVGSRPAE